MADLSTQDTYSSLLSTTKSLQSSLMQSTTLNAKISQPEISIESEKPLKERNSFYNTLLMLLVASGGYYFGFYIGVFNALGTELLIQVYNIPNEKEIRTTNGRINMFFTVGNLVGVLIVTYLTNKIGRRRLLILAELLGFLLFFAYTVQNLHVLLGVRFLCGVAGGVNSAIVPIFITEMIPRSKSGVGNIFSCLVAVSFTFLGLAMECIFGIPWLLERWKLVLAWPVAISTARLLLLFMFVRNETPLHILKAYNGNAEKARRKALRVLKRIYKPESARRVYNTLVESESKKAKSDQPEAGLLSKKYRLRLLTGVVLQIGQQLSGINFLIFFSRDFFQRVSQNGGTMAFVIGAANIFGALLGLKLINFFGRKANMQFGVLIQGLSFFAIYFSIQYQKLITIIPPIAVSLYMTGFSLGLGATLVSFLTEILPPAGVGYSFIVQYIASSAIAGFSQQLEGAIGSTNLILGFAVVCIVVFCILDVLVKETKGKDELQITKEYENFRYRPLKFS